MQLPVVVEEVIFYTRKRQNTTGWLITVYDERQDPKDEIVYGSSNSLKKHCGLTKPFLQVGLCRRRTAGISNINTLLCYLFEIAYK